MKLWLDDVRKPPDDSWTWCKSVEEALKIADKCEEWALDHDLGGQLAHYGKGEYDFTAPTGADFIRWYCRDARITKGRQVLPPKVSIHSTNLPGVRTMVDMLCQWSVGAELDIDIIVRPMRGFIMDRTPYHYPALRIKA